MRKIMKKAGILFLTFCFVSIGSHGFAQNDAKELLVFAGVGMREPLDDIGKGFEEIHGVQVMYDYEGSGRLGNKILVGQVPDVFIPGSDKWARLLKEKGYIKDCSPVAYHTPVIITPLGNSAVTSLKDFTDHRVVLGDAQAAAIGGATEIILRNAGIKESEIKVKARGITVKQLVLWIEKNNADASIVWKADAVQSGKVKIIAIPKQYNSIGIIPVCQMAEGNQWASKYVQYVLSDEGKKIFARYGFEVVK